MLLALITTLPTHSNPPHSQLFPEAEIALGSAGCSGMRRSSSSQSVRGGGGEVEGWREDLKLKLREGQEKAAEIER